VSPEKRQAIKQAMLSGGANLARSSGLADPRASAMGDSWAYESADMKYILVFASSEEKVDVQQAEVRASDVERVEWGKKAGQLLSGSRVEDGPKVGGNPTVFTELFMRSGGGRMQSYDIFVSKQPGTEIPSP
jgi:hypothetical protein